MQSLRLLPSLAVLAAACGARSAANSADGGGIVYPISSAMEPGPTETGLYRSVTPFEHADIGRTHVYPANFGGSLGSPELNAVEVRQFSGVHETPYNIVTRNRDQLVLFGGSCAVLPGRRLGRQRRARREPGRRLRFRARDPDFPPNRRSLQPVERTLRFAVARIIRDLLSCLKWREI